MSWCIDTLLEQRKDHPNKSCMPYESRKFLITHLPKTMLCSSSLKTENPKSYLLEKHIALKNEHIHLLEPQNCRFKDEKASYLSCIQNLKEIRSTIDAVTSPQPKSPEREVVERSNEPELTLTPEQNNDFNFDF